MVYEEAKMLKQTISSNKRDADGLRMEVAMTNKQVFESRLEGGVFNRLTKRKCIETWKQLTGKRLNHGGSCHTKTRRRFVKKTENDTKNKI